jgi:hypothetical protein
MPDALPRAAEKRIAAEPGSYNEAVTQRSPSKSAPPFGSYVGGHSCPMPLVQLTKSIAAAFNSRMAGQPAPATKRLRPVRHRNPRPISNARLKTRIIVAFNRFSPSLPIAFHLEWLSRCGPEKPEGRKAALGGVRDLLGDLPERPC